MVSEYEKEKARNIERNAAILRSLGLHQPLFEPVEQKPKETKLVKKRKASVDSEEGSPVAKVTRVESPVSGGVRRSSRTSGKKVDYTAEQQRRVPLPKTDKKKPPRAPSQLNQVRRYDPKMFGSIPGVEIGSWWATRMECSRDSIHAPTVAGISGGPKGAYSVALSGGYEDDVDLGYAFTYTGSGGRDLKGTKAAPKNLRTAPQSSDQSFDNPFNSALKHSCESGKPIRVVRGYKLHSKYAPSEGYRYDGLYKVEKAWIEQGLNPGKYLVCKFAFKRLPDQPPLPVRAVDGDGEEENPGSENSGEDLDQDTE